MSQGGAPLGNQNAAKAKRWQKALERVLARKYGDVDAGLEVLALKFIEMHEVSDTTTEVCKDVADRFDGKPAQQLQLSGDSENPLVVEIVKFNANKTASE